MLNILLSFFVVVVAYLVGSLCSAVIVSRIFSLPDPCTEGSKNPGATNVLRLAGKKYAAIVLAGDMLKGFLPVLLAKMLNVPLEVVGFTCLAAVVGHMYPVFFGFKGGKGVATAIGAFLALHFMMGVVIVATWLIVANLSHYSSLASIVSIILAPLYAIVSTGTVSTFPPLLLITALVLYKHRKNITRLTDGEEPQIHFKHNQLSDVADELETMAESESDEPVAVTEQVDETIIASPEKPAATKKTVSKPKSKPKSKPASKTTDKTPGKTAAKPAAAKKAPKKAAKPKANEP